MLLTLTGCPVTSTKAKDTPNPEFSGTWGYTATGLGSGTDKLTFRYLVQGGYKSNFIFNRHHHRSREPAPNVPYIKQ